MIAEANVETTKASKYLKWLCGHFKIKVKADYDETQGKVEFSIGVCDMQAHPDHLYMRVEAPDEESFAQLKDLVGGHLERFAHKDSIQVTWVNQKATETP